MTKRREGLLQRVAESMNRRLKKIGGWHVILIALCGALLFGSPPEEDCLLSAKRDFTSVLAHDRIRQRALLAHVTLDSVDYSDHPDDGPAYEQLIFHFRSTTEQESDRSLCVHVDDVAADQLRVTFGATAIETRTFPAALRRVHETLPSGSIYKTIVPAEGDNVSFLVRLSRTASYRFFSSRGPGGY